MKRNPQSELKVWQELRNPQCTSCELHSGADTVCFLGNGPIPAEGMIVGDTPGSTEEETGIAFSGKSGLFLRRMLKECGLKPASFYYAYTVACRSNGSKAPKKSIVKTCSNLYLKPQIELVKPRVVLMLGNNAASSILGRKTTITKMEGTSIEIGGVIYVPSRSPNAVIRAEGEPGYDYLVQQFKENCLIFKNAINPSADTFKFVRPKEFPGGEFNEGSVYTDLESNGLNPFLPTSKIHSMGLAQDPNRIYSFPTKEEDRKKYSDFYREHPISAHRGTHEGIFIRRHYGVKPRIYFDSKVAAHLLDENRQTGLKYQAIRHLNVDPWVEEQDFENPNFDKMLPYNAKDTCYGLRLCQEVYYPHLRRYPKQAKLMKYIILPAMEVFIDVICRGFHIDQKMAEEKLIICEQKMKEFNDKIDEIAGYRVNPGSPKQMVKLLYEDLGLKCPVFTKKGAKSSSEAALIRLAGKHAIADVTLEWRKWKKYASTYLKPWIAKGPILHANYGFTGTTTGRLNSTMVRNKRSEKKLGATLHQCPRDPFIRNLIAPRGYVEMPWEDIKSIEPEDWSILSADLSQLELRLVANASGDKTMIKIFNTGSDIRHWNLYHNPELKSSPTYRGEKCPECDIHFSTARSLTHGEIDKETRKKAKAVNFGFVYGMFARKFVLYAKEKFSLDLSVKDGERYRETFFNTYEGLLPWHRRVEAFVTQNGFIDSVWGRRRHLPEAQDFEIDEWKRREAIRQAINSPIQGGGSDLNLLIAALIFGSLPWDFKVDPQQCFLVGSAHDSLITECKKSYVQTMREGIKYTTSNIGKITRKYFNFEFRVPIVMDAEVYKDHWEGEKLLAS